MADNTTAQATPDEAERVDLTTPVYLVFRQTEKRTSVEAFQGPNALAEAKARASQHAARTGDLVAIFGPQSNVFAPPPKAVAQEVQLSFV
jgi:hypothetical protein